MLGLLLGDLHPVREGIFVLSIIDVCLLVLAALQLPGLECTQTTPLAGGAFLLPEGTSE